MLAAGRGTRMHSALPKVLHTLAGRPMVRLVCDAVRDAGCRDIVLVVAPDGDDVARAAGPGTRIATQSSPLGTGHAALAARDAAADARRVLIVNADLPLITSATLREMAAQHTHSTRQNASTQPLTFLTALLDDPSGYGRVIRKDGRVLRIVEESETDESTRNEQEVNAGLYAADGAWLWPALEALTPGPRGEIYLTDLVALATGHGEAVQACRTGDAAEVQQVNTRVELAAAERVLRDRVRHRLMLAGVTLVDPPTTFIDVGVEVGVDSTLLPGVHLLGETTIGAGCRIGPNAVLRDVRTGDRCEIGGSTLEEATLADGVTVGPYCHVRAGSTIESNVRLGNYAEVKASRLGAGTRVGHFSYIGDSDVGRDVNIGAGTVTCNFDGVNKHRTRIGDGAFIGSDSMLVAPLEVGAGASTAAGSVVTHDVPAGAQAIGAPARIRRPGDGTPDDINLSSHEGNG